MSQRKAVRHTRKMGWGLDIQTLATRKDLPPQVGTWDCGDPRYEGETSCQTCALWPRPLK